MGRRVGRRAVRVATVGAGAAWVVTRTAVRAARRRPRLTALVATALVLSVVGLLSLVRSLAGPEVVRVVAAGDMACDPDDPDFLARSEAEGDHCRQDAVSALALSLDPAVLLGLGDYQYELPTADAYHDVYGPTWGRLRDVTIPALGNQEYKIRDATTFRDYFGGRVRDIRGYWSEDVGRWHVVVLNSNCGAVDGGCAEGSEQQRWLAADLASTDRRCVVATWHHPRFSTGIAGSDERTRDLFRTLYDHRVELVLSGHEAHYERFGPLDPDGQPDPDGVRQFVVGTGGQAHYEPTQAETGGRNPFTHPTSEFTDFHHHGVLDLELRPAGWRWQFHALGQGPVDTGTGSCA